MDPAVSDANAVALRAFNDVVAADDRVEVAVLVAFDGLTIARKR
jgi:caffeoyl-CoA O-methyltransferase